MWSVIQWKLRTSEHKSYSGSPCTEKTPYLWIFAMLRKSPMRCVKIFQTCGDPHSFLDIQVAGRSRISFGKFSWEKEGSIGVLSGGNKLCDFFFSKHHTYALFLLRKKNNLSSDCIFYLTLGLLIFHLLNLYDFPTFSSFGIQPVPSPCALIEAPYKKISSEHRDWRCNEITQKGVQLVQKIR